jgi:polyribonucleotide nucleotidyltransferase
LIFEVGTVARQADGAVLSSRATRWVLGVRHRAKVERKGGEFLPL